MIAWLMDTNEITRSPPKGGKIRRTIRARLKEGFSASELIQAATHARADKFWKGQSITTIWDSDARIVQFLTSGAESKMPDRVIDGLSSGAQQWLNQKNEGGK